MLLSQREAGRAQPSVSFILGIVISEHLSAQLIIMHAACSVCICMYVCIYMHHTVTGVGSWHVHTGISLASNTFHRERKGLISLIPRPHPLTRRKRLVNQVEFFGLAHAFVTMQPSNDQNILRPTHSKEVRMLKWR